MMTGILLAGGKSKRMGEDKAFLQFKGKYLFEFPLSILIDFTDEIIISSSNMDFKNTGHIIIKDEIPNLGPLGGIYSCLKRSTYLYSLILPCDIPLLDLSIPEVLLHNHIKYDITVALNHNNFPEPLIGVYSKNLLPLIEKQIHRGNLKLMDLLGKVNTNYVTLEKEVFNQSSKPFLNINTKKDLIELNNSNG